MRRALVLTNEAARHPFRQSLPREIFAVPAASRQPLGDLQLFLLTFVAGFVAFLGFLA